MIFKLQKINKILKILMKKTFFLSYSQKNKVFLEKAKNLVRRLKIIIIINSQSLKNWVNFRKIIKITYYKNKRATFISINSSKKA